MMNVGQIAHVFSSSQEIAAAQQRGANLETKSYICGGCGKHVHGRIVAKASCDEGGFTGEMQWCLCPCNQPSVFTTLRLPAGELRIQQHPRAIEFPAGSKWPEDLSKLFSEASKAFSASAFTACAMVCRKILMAIACKYGEPEGNTFAQYVSFILDKVIPITSARASIDSIRKIGNDANHDVAFVTEPDARRAMEISQYILNAVYSLPAA